MTRLQRNRALQSILVSVLTVAFVFPVPLLAADDLEGTRLSAENFAQLGQQSVATRAITPETLRQSMALLKAAMKLNPDEPRFARLLAEAALQAGDVDVAYEAYKAIDRIEKGNDRVAQIRLMDLHTGKLQTADARIEYLSKLTESDKFAAEVRAHAALLVCNILIDRAEPGKAMEKLDEALRLFPLYPEALRLKWELTGTTGTPRERVALLLTMLRSNPSQPGVMAKIASELADLRLHDASMQWYGAAIGLAQRVGRGVVGEDLDHYAALLVINNQIGAADEFVGQLLKADPRDVDAAFLGLIIARLGGDAEKLEKARADAEQALLGRAQMIHQQLEGGAPDAAATTQPVGEVNVPADVRKLIELGDPQITAAYASTLADLAWMYIYFSAKPDLAAPVIANLQQLLPADSITLARLDGWSYLAAGKTQEARVKLSAVADRDPLAQLGMLRLMDQDPPSRERALSEARLLMDANSSGLLGAIIHDALRDKKLKPPPGQQPPLSAEAVQVKYELDAFPKEWLSFIDKPQDFYLLRGEPLKVSHAFGEPIIARITIKNLGIHDITVGPEGAIRPDLWFDVTLRGLMQNGYSGVAFDRLTQHVVLKPQQQIVQNVRVDQGQLPAVLQQSAAVVIPVYFSVFDNPITLATGISPGPGGQRQAFTKVVNRLGVPANDKGMDAALNELANGLPDARLRAVDRLLWFARGLAQMADPQMRARAGQLMTQIRKTGNDPNPQVRAWTNYLFARALDPDSRRKVIEEMLTDSAWESRLLGALLVQTLDAAEWKKVVAPLAQNDPEPVVKEFATAVVAFADNPAATQPTTQPSPDEKTGPVARP